MPSIITLVFLAVGMLLATGEDPNMAEPPPEVALKPYIIAPNAPEAHLSPKDVYEDISSNYPLKTQEIGRAIISVESEWNPAARNPESTAKGLFQILDGTWEENCEGSPLSPADNIECGLSMLEKGEYWRWGSSQDKWISKVSTTTRNQINILCSCVRGVRSFGVNVPRQDAEDFEPNTSMGVGKVIIQDFNGVAHIGLVEEITNDGLLVRSTNRSRCKETLDLIKWNDGTLVGFYEHDILAKN